MMKFPITLNTDTIKDFQRDGFVVTPEVLDDRQVARFGSAVDAEVVRRTAADKRPIEEKSTYEQSFLQCMRLWETCAITRELSCHPALAGIAAQLLNEDSMLLWQDQALYKEPGGRETTAHQDQPFWPIGTAPLVSAWIPFCDITIDSGAMAYVPGSHKHGGLKIVDITHATEPYDILNDPLLQGTTPRPVEIKAGDVIWHHGFTVHKAFANDTNKLRRVFTTVYMARGYPRAKPWPVFPLDRAGVAVGELMEGEGLPEVWPVSEQLPIPPKKRGQTTGPQH